MKLALTQPLRLLDREIRELDLRDEVVAGDIWDLRPPIGPDGTFDAPVFGDVLTVAARLTRNPQLPPDAVRDLSVQDALALYQAVLPLLFAGRPNGSGLSASSSSTAGYPPGT